DLPGAAKTVEIVDVNRTEKSLERVKDVLGIDAHRLALVTVQIRAKLRHVCPENREEFLDLVALTRPVNDGIDLPLQLLDTQVAAVLDDNLETARRREARYRRRRVDRHFRLGDFLLQLILDASRNRSGRKPRILAFVEGIEGDEKVAEVGAVRIQCERL